MYDKVELQNQTASAPNTFLSEFTNSSACICPSTFIKLSIMPLRRAYTIAVLPLLCQCHTKSKVIDMAKKTNLNDNEAESKRILERVAQESETVGTSSVKRIAERVKGHISADDTDENEWAELWGKRIGRALGEIFVIILIIHLLRTYLFHA